jgi:signal peptidase I
MQGQFGALGVIGIIFTAVLASAVRAAFFVQRWKRAHTEDADLSNPPMSGGQTLDRVPKRLWPVVKPLFFASIVVLGALQLVMLFAFIFVRPWVIPTAAMEPTLLIGDRVFTLRPNWMGAIHRGDLVAFAYPVDPKQAFIKRVVGVPGDRIRVVHKALYLNGDPIAEPYATHLTEYIDLYRDEFPSQPSVHLYPPGDRMLSENVRNGEVVVPPGMYFVMGDNRDSSLDSRYWGFVPMENILGRPWMIYESTDAAGRSRPGRSGKMLRRFPLGFTSSAGPLKVG